MFVVASALYLPLLGTFGLWDPWETHYGEVAREILSRDDWISLWWAQDRWFWSKPIFIFWAEALLWSASGIDYLPDSNFEHAEWVLRLPTYVVSVAGAARRVRRDRAAVEPARRRCSPRSCCATMPYYALLTHQAITDMPFVGTMTVAVMLLLLARARGPRARGAAATACGRFAVSAQELVLGAVPAARAAAGAVPGEPQRHASSTGCSPGTATTSCSARAATRTCPATSASATSGRASAALFVQPLAQALLLGRRASRRWCTLLRRERRAQALYMIAFYMLCALSFMAKGIPGFALPGLIALLYLSSCGAGRCCSRGGCGSRSARWCCSCVGMPWFVAMYVRHGAGFTNRLLIHDHLNRLTKGVHGDTGSIEYFIEQLGYGMFPWIALAPLALGSWLCSPTARGMRLEHGCDARSARPRS